jgi:hypothetical protein
MSASSYLCAKDSDRLDEATLAPRFLGRREEGAAGHAPALESRTEGRDGREAAERSLLQNRRKKGGVTDEADA